MCPHILTLKNMGRVDLAGLLFNLLGHLITKLFGQYETSSQSGFIKTIWTIITKQFEKSEFVKTIWTIITKRFEEKKRVRQNSLHNYHQTIWEKQICHRKYLNNQKPVSWIFYAFSFNQLLQRKEIWPNCSKLGFAKYLNVEQIWAEN